jgi:hypothetical protein
MGKLLIWEAIKELCRAGLKFIPMAYLVITSGFWTAEFLMKIFLD